MNAVSPNVPTLAYSPCPNDTFIFAAWTQGKLPDAPAVNVVLDDVEALNAAGREGRYELTKVSYGAIPSLLPKYRILRSGGALGSGCGPLLVVRPDHHPGSLASLPAHARIAIPGHATTAYLLLRLALGRPIDAVEMRFDTIVDAVKNGEVDAGLIIHESRFTYEQAGLTSLVDLGAWWEESTGKPIPLGAILVRRDIDVAAARNFDDLIRRSLQFAYDNDAEVMPYVRQHAFEMNEDVMRAHIALYVNEFSFDVGEAGEGAVRTLFSRAADAHLLPASTLPEFVDAA